MKKFPAILFLFFVCSSVAISQTIVFSDDFESGLSKWICKGTWGTVSSVSHSPLQSITDSPEGIYADSVITWAMIKDTFDLTAAKAAEVSFYATFKLETGFDYVYLEASKDHFNTFVLIDKFNGGEKDTLKPFAFYKYNIGGLAGNSHVNIRFRMITDQAVNSDGIYIDDFTVTTLDTDNAPPMIVHAVPKLYEGVLEDFSVKAEITDVSGIALAELSYIVDGGSIQKVTGIHTSGSGYEFKIPSQPSGSWVDYFITAVDSVQPANIAVSDTGKYIAGNHLIYDNGVVTHFVTFGPDATGGEGLSGAAVRISFAEGFGDLVTLLIRNFTSDEYPETDITAHVWTIENGHPADDLIPPFPVNPEASEANTTAMTRVDLRPYSSQLSNITGHYYVGFTIDSGSAYLCLTDPYTFYRSEYLDNITKTWNSTPRDLHIRAVTSEIKTHISPVEFSDQERVFPNPMTSQSELRWNETLPPKVIPCFELYSLIGEKMNPVYTIYDHSLILYRGNLAPGTYFYRIFSERRIYIQGKLTVGY